MIYGISGNPNKDLLWEPVTELIGWLLERDIEFGLHHAVADGLAARGLVSSDILDDKRVDDLADGSEIVLSFGGDGTLLNTAKDLGASGTPILGVNIGRLGFLTGVEAEHVQGAIEAVEAGRFEVEKRFTLEARIEGHAETMACSG